MKKSLFIICFCLSTSLYLRAQNTFPTSGNVGVGTTSPSHELVIEGASSPNIELKNSNYSNGGFIINRTNYGNQWKWWAESNIMKFSFSNDETNYSNKLTIKSNGNIGIGSENPSHKLVIEGVSSPNIELKNSNYSNGGFILNRTNYGNQWKWWAQSNVMYFGFSTDETNYSNMFTIKSNGNTGIGTASPDAKLAVKGNIHTNEVKVDLLGAVAPDYVFFKDYDLKTLTEVESYITEKGHLPNIPSAKEMETNGLYLKEMNLKLLEKIEELTLYTINQEKELQNQKTINKTLEEKFKTQEIRLQKIETILNSKK